MGLFPGGDPGQGFTQAAIGVELVGADEFVTKAEAVAGATGTMATSFEESGLAADTAAASYTRAGTAMEATTKRGFLLNQMLYSARRYAFYGTTALLAIGAGAVYAGFKFDAMMQSSQLAFSGLLHSSSAARSELKLLFNMAAHSPFLFSNLTTGVRQLLAMQFSVAQANKVLAASANTLAYLGHPENLPRLTYVFGEIHQSGYLMMRQMRQLYMAGVPIFPALREELHLTQLQIEEFMRGKLRIPSDIGIAALLRYMNTHFGDGMARFSKTWTGRWTTFKDYAQMMMGKILQGPFNSLISGLGHLNDGLQKLITAYNNGGWDNFLNKLDSMAGAGGFLASAISQVAMNLRTFWNILTGSVIPALKDGFTAALVIYRGLYPLNWIINQLSQHGLVLRLILDYIIIRFLLLKAYVYATTLIMGGYRAVMKAVWLITEAVAFAQFLYRAAMVSTNFQTFIATAMTWNLNTAMLYLKFQLIWTSIQLRAAALAMWLYEAAGWAATAATWALDAAMTALDIAFWVSPIGLIILAIVGLVAAIVVLVLWFGKVKDAAVAVWDLIVKAASFAFSFVKAHWKDLLIFLATGPIGWVLYHFWDPIVNGLRAALNWVVNLMEGLWSTVESWVKTGLNWIIDKINMAINAWNSATGWIPFIGSAVHVGMIPHLAAGGNVIDAGLVVVGERGPELLQLPRGASVSPMTSLDTSAMAAARSGLIACVTAVIPVMLDSEVLAEHQADILLSEGARA